MYLSISFKQYSRASFLDFAFFPFRSIPNKGHGLVAIRDIGSGDLIAAEKPLIKVELTPEGDLLGKFDQNKQEVVSPPLLKALNELPDNDLIKFYSLSGKNTNICTLNVVPHLKGSLITYYL